MLASVYPPPCCQPVDTDPSSQPVVLNPLLILLAIIDRFSRSYCFIVKQRSRFWVEEDLGNARCIDCTYIPLLLSTASSLTLYNNETI